MTKGKVLIIGELMVKQTKDAIRRGAKTQLGTSRLELHVSDNAFLVQTSRIDG